MFLDKSRNEFGNDISVGLSNIIQKTTPSKYLYDEIGSELFEKITLQPEYYPTKTEIKILENYSNEIINFLASVVSNLENSLKNVIVKGIPYEYIDGINHCNNILFENNIEIKNISRLIIFLGSSIGNFEIDDARNFLKDVRLHITNDDFLLVGFDLIKDISVMESAYNDANSITAMFNLNLLNRINKELGGNFIITNFSHKAFYNMDKKRIEMHLVSIIEQQVFISSLNKEIFFRKNETIHTENSYKYSPDDISRLIKRAGFSIEREFFDENNWYELILLRPN